jgi:hypothetical protein
MPWTFRQKYLLFLYYMYIMKINDPQGGDNFDHRAIIWTILLEVYFTMFHAKYLTSSICQLLEEFFLQFYYKFLYYIHIKKTNDPRGGADFDLRAIIWTIWIEVYQTMPYAKYLSSRPLWSLQEGILSFYYMYIKWKSMTPGVGPILTLGI